MLIGRRVFSGEKHPQYDYNRRLRTGEVVSVDAEQGTCKVAWYDTPGVRDGVLLTQGSDGEFSVPAIGSAVICGAGPFEEMFVLRYIPKAWVPRMKSIGDGGKSDLPPMQGKERYIESKTKDGRRAFVYVSQTGSVEMTSANGNTIGIDDPSRTVVVDSESARTVTSSGVSFAGAVKRLVGNTLTRIKRATNGKFFAERKATVFEYTDGPYDLIGPSSKLVEATFGTVVNDSGVVVDKLGRPTVLLSRKKELVVEIKFASGVTLQIDKEGKITLGGVTGRTININGASVDTSDPDLVSGLERNRRDLGTRGQHVAREHDEVTVPVGSGLSETEHLGLKTLSSANLSALEDFITTHFVVAGSAIQASSPGVWPAFRLKGEITGRGSEGVLIG